MKTLSFALVSACALAWAASAPAAIAPQPRLDMAWSCAAYCRYESNIETFRKAIVADGPTLSTAFKAMTDQCDALQGVIEGGSIAGGGQQTTYGFAYGIPSATQACAKN